MTIWLLQLVISSPLIHALVLPKSSPHQDLNMGHERQTTYQLSYPLRLLSGCRLHWNRQINRLKCCFCDVLFNDWATHVLFDCVCMRQNRDIEWQRVNSTMPPALSIEFERMSIIKGTLKLCLLTLCAKWIINRKECQF